MRTAVRDQLVRMSRPPVALEIIRRRHQQSPQRDDRLTDDVFSADVARLDANIVTLLDRIVDAIVVVQFDDQFGVLLLKPANIPGELVREERGDAAHAQRAGKPDSERAHRRLRLVEFRNDAHASFEITRARIGQRQPAG